MEKMKCYDALKQRFIFWRDKLKLPCFSKMLFGGMMEWKKGLADRGLLHGVLENTDAPGNRGEGEEAVDYSHAERAVSLHYHFIKKKNSNFVIRAEVA